jgi:hypothetical protein
MKKFLITTILVALIAAGTVLKAQDSHPEYLGLPGDNLNLYAVMKLFQESKTLEDFERDLNDPNNRINNLDLNGDNLIDYIKVIDNVDGDVHNIVLQVAVSPKENQDVAVFTVQRFPNGQVQIQLIGDEQLYGKDYIIEPIYDNANQGGTPNPGYTGNTRIVDGQTVTYVNTTPVQIATWPLIRFIFLPTYTVWHSPWYWGYYPGYWHTWHPFSWNFYYGYHYNWDRYYYGHYRQWNYHRYSRWNDFYYNGRRSYSPDIHHRVEMGYYKSTYSHPEQRKDGEALFANSHPDQYRRSASVSKGNYSNVTRRSTTTMTNKSVSNPQPGNSTVINRRSATTITNKPAGNRPTSASETMNRKSTTTVTDKSVINHSAGQNAGINHSREQKKPMVVTSSSRRNETNNKSATTVKKETRTKESDKKEPDHNKQ